MVYASHNWDEGSCFRVTCGKEMVITWLHEEFKMPFSRSLIYFSLVAQGIITRLGIQSSHASGLPVAKKRLLPGYKKNLKCHFFDSLLISRLWHSEFNSSALFQM